MADDNPIEDMLMFCGRGMFVIEREHTFCAFDKKRVCDKSCSAYQTAFWIEKGDDLVVRDV